MRVALTLTLFLYPFSLGGLSVPLSLSIYLCFSSKALRKHTLLKKGAEHISGFALIYVALKNILYSNKKDSQIIKKIPI